VDVREEELNRRWRARIFKRALKGIYQHCSEKHLHRYLAELDHK
jgi:hypothetical protein